MEHAVRQKPYKEYGYNIEKSIIKVNKKDRNSINKNLLNEFKKTKDKKIAEKIIFINLPIILSCIKSFGIKKHTNLYDDFVAEGLIELNNCINKYNFKKGKLSTYAFACINKKILRLFYKYKNQIKIPYETGLKLKKLNDSLFSENKKQLSKKDQELLKLNFTHIHDNQDEDLKNKNYIQKYKENLQNLENKHYAEECYDILIPTLKSLKIRDQTIISKYYGINQKAISDYKISKDIGITKQRVYQIRKQILKKLRKVLDLKLSGSTI